MSSCGNECATEALDLSVPPLEPATRFVLRSVRHGPWLFGQADAAEDRQHENAAYDSEGGHEIKVIAPTSIKQRSEKITGKTATEVLKRIDDAGREAGHFRAANIHGGRGSQNRMR